MYCNSCNKEFIIKNQRSFTLIEALSLDIAKEIDIKSPFSKNNVIIVASGQKWIECQDCNKIIEKNYYQTKDWDEFQLDKKFFLNDDFNSFFERLVRQKNQAFEIIESLGIYENKLESESDTKNKSKSTKSKQKFSKEEIDEYITEAVRILRRENLVYPAIPIYESNLENNILLIEFLIGNKERSHNTRFEIDQTTHLLEKIIRNFPEILEYDNYNNIISKFNKINIIDDKYELIKTHLINIETSKETKENNSTEIEGKLVKCSVCGFRLSPNDIKLNKKICKQCEIKTQ